MKTGFKQECVYCSEKFPPQDDWQLFCSNKCKVRWNRENPDHCFYCYDVAQCRDHILPVFYRKGKRRYGGQETVKCCNECNSFLSNNKFNNIWDRIDFLIIKYKKKYGLTKGEIYWSEEDLEELGHNLRSHIQQKQSKKERAKEKLILMHVRKLDLFSFDSSANEFEYYSSDD